MHTYQRSLKRLYSLVSYTALANSYLVCFHDVYQCQGHAH